MGDGEWGMRKGAWASCPHECGRHHAGGTPALLSSAAKKGYAGVYFLSAETVGAVMVRCLRESSMALMPVAMAGAYSGANWAE